MASRAEGAAQEQCDSPPETIPHKGLRGGTAWQLCLSITKMRNSTTRCTWSSGGLNAPFLRLLCGGTRSFLHHHLWTLRSQKCLLLPESADMCCFEKSLESLTFLPCPARLAGYGKKGNCSPGATNSIPRHSAAGEFEQIAR